MMPDALAANEYDCQWTLRNRHNLVVNQNLLAWYRKLYERVFEPFGDVGKLSVLEIGSGSSPLKMLYRSVKTSDLLELPYLDYVFDCHDIDRLPYLEHGSLDIITMTNVLHHLSDPVSFLNRAAHVLKPGGWIVAVEPYHSVLSKMVYRMFHHEPSDFSVQSPMLSETVGPLSSANMALPQLIFFEREEWAAPLRDTYCFFNRHFEYFSSLSYLATGGISRRIPLPGFLYRPFLDIDTTLADLHPNLFASFVIIRLQKRFG